MSSGGFTLAELVLPSSNPSSVTNWPTTHSGTILVDGARPTMVISLPALRLIPPSNLRSKVNIKPAVSSAMMGFWAPAMRNFWPLWESGGATAADIVGGNTGTLTATGYPGSIAWSTAISLGYGPTWPTTPQPFINKTAVPSSATVDVVLATPVVLSGSWSIDLCWRVPGFSLYWTHLLITNDPVNGIVGYVDGVATPNWATTCDNHVGALTNNNPLVSGVYTPSFTITGLLQALGYINGGAQHLEYLRIWNRVLNYAEIQSLANDPFCMFGVTTETLDEIVNIISFMTPSKENWFLSFTE